MLAVKWTHLIITCVSISMYLIKEKLVCSLVFTAISPLSASNRFQSPGIYSQGRARYPVASENDAEHKENRPRIKSVTNSKALWTKQKQVPQSIYVFI